MIEHAQSASYVEAMAFKLGITVDLCTAYYVDAPFDDLDLGRSGSARGKQTFKL